MKLNTYRKSYNVPMLKNLFWLLISLFFFETKIPYPSILKRLFLRLFGANIGVGVVIKPRVKIKFPWKLKVGNYSWIGEKVWIDNLAFVNIGNNCCLSQESYVLTGNHNYSSENFELMIGEVLIEDCVWLGAKSIVCPNVSAMSGSVLSVGSVANKNLEPWSIYQGNPAEFIRKRVQK